MANPEKARLKAELAQSLADEYAEAISNSEKNVIGITAARDTVERLLARVGGYRKKIDEAFEKGTFPEASRDPVYAVFKDLASLVNDSFMATRQAASEQVPFTGGLRKAHSMAMERVKREILIAEAAERQMQEDEAERAIDATPAAVESVEPEPVEVPVKGKK